MKLKIFTDEKRIKISIHPKEEKADETDSLNLNNDKNNKENKLQNNNDKKDKKRGSLKADEQESYWANKKEQDKRNDIEDEDQEDHSLSLDADKKKKETEAWEKETKEGTKNKVKKSDSELSNTYKNNKNENSSETKNDSKEKALSNENDRTKKEIEDEADFESLLTKSNTEIKYAKSKDWGEQTIDYRKLNDEFGGISTDREGQDGDGMQFKHGEVPQSEEVRNDGIETIETPPIIAEPKGLDDLISVLELYLEKKSPAIILDNISEIVVKKGAEWSLFCKSDGSKLELTSFGGLDPIKANQKVTEYNDEWLNKGLPEWSDLNFKSPKYILLPLF